MKDGHCVFCGENLGEKTEFQSWFHLTFRCPSTTPDEKRQLKKDGWR